MFRSASQEARSTGLSRFASFLESGLTQTFIGTVCGIAGAFINGHWFLALGLFIPLALHRQKSLAGLHKATAWLIAIGSGIAAVLILWWLGTQLNTSRHSPSAPVTEITKPSDILDAIRNLHQEKTPTAQVEPQVQPVIAAPKSAAVQSRQVPILELRPEIRIISNAQIVQFHKAISDNGVLKAKGEHNEPYPRNVPIYADPNDDEAVAYATQLQLLLLREGWDVDVITGDRIDGITGPGIHLVQKGAVSNTSRSLGMRANLAMFSCLVSAGFLSQQGSLPARHSGDESTFIVVGASQSTETIHR